MRSPSLQLRQKKAKEGFIFSLDFLESVKKLYTYKVGLLMLSGK